ncbi:uncharacterized protein LOC143078098 [Mytilus galloprovincialis]|uniref:uncharacterized protein LOC143078098 n=1 Tax=Mytilus galloprovincialis TaxID=29158 RepID=UPI003F7BA5C7
MAMCLIFAACVLILTVLWMYIGKDWSFSFLANAMFFPTLLLPLFVENYIDFIITITGINEIQKSLLYSFVAIIAVYVLVYGCVALGILLSWATQVDTPTQDGNAIHEHNSDIIKCFLRAAGEEIGWRCYLLPCLLSMYSPTLALLISGIIWGLFHVPVMILLTYKLKVPRPYLTIFVQSLSCVMMAYLIGWVAVKSKFSLWACSILHCVWNRVNPMILGSIYTQTPGVYNGEQWKINGEGLAGCIVFLPVALLCVYDLSFTM